MRVRPLILLAVIAIAAGCSRAPEEPKEVPEVYTMKDNSYMRDPEFIKVLQNRAKVRNGALARREKVLVQLEGLAENDPARPALEQQLKDLNTELHAIQDGIREVTRERMNRAIEDEKLVEAGKAKAK